MGIGFGLSHSAPAPSAARLVPTGEQAMILAAFRARANLVVNAGAGTGKTSTLKMLAGAAPSKRLLYIAYNKAIADDSKASFPSNTECRTAHSLAFRAVGIQYAQRLNSGRVSSWMVAQRLGVQPVKTERRLFTAAKAASLVMQMVKGFCYSSYSELHPGHLGYVLGLDEKEHKLVAETLLPYAQKAWADISDTQGTLPFTHDCYLKLWALGLPRLGYDVVMLDEAQDANPVIADIVERQTQAQRVLVGDQAQAIYGWRGAIDAMATFEGERLVLSQSFRFGQAIADEANRWLDRLNAPLRLTGRVGLNSRVGKVETPRAVLCRTNAGAVLSVMRALDAGQKPALVGGAEQIKAMARAAIELERGQGCGHPDLIAFKSWQDVQTFVKEEDAGSDLRVFVNLIDDYGARAVIATLDRAVDESGADVVVSTAHRAKGREWDSVKVADDFPDRVKGGGEQMLAYVTVTRAKLALDKGKLRAR